MAWLGNFDDFNQFDDSSAPKPTHKQNNYFRKRKAESNSKPQQRPPPQDPPEVKRLRDITPNSSYSNITLTGVIIAKEQQRTVFSKKNVGSERHVVCFTLRDSPACFVNVTCWGNAGFISDISNNFDVGSVVKVKNAQVQSKSSNPNDEKFKPWTPLPFQVSVSETHGAVEAYDLWDAASLQHVLRVPTRPASDYHTLEDVKLSGASLQGEHVNLLAAVKRVGQIKYLTTKTGKQTKKCDVTLCDDTCPSFPLDLWQNHADASLAWTPFETVLFIADVKVVHNAFKGALVATADSKTVFTADPSCQEAQCLRQFLRTQDRTATDPADQPDTDPDPSSVTETLSVQQLHQKRCALARDPTAANVYGRMDVVLTHFNVDGRDEEVVRHMCGRCRRMVRGTPSTCSSCGSDLSVDGSTVWEFCPQVSLSDLTGTATPCRLTHALAETMLGCKPELFVMLPEAQRTGIKWRHLMEDVNVVVKLKPNRQPSDRLPVVHVLALTRPAYADPKAAHRR